MNFSFLKQALLVACILPATQNLFAQATLPTSCNFDDADPTGWTESLQGGNVRYVGGQVGTACRLDETDDYVVVNFADVPGDVSYYIKGQGTTIVTNDTFTVEQSVNGIDWTELRRLVGVDIDNNAYVNYTDHPAVTTRYIRWYFTKKQSGVNVALDEITVSQSVPTNEQEISVLFNGNTAVENSDVIVGNSTSSTIRIQNVGLADPLTVSGITFSGPAAGDYSIASLSVPFDVTAQNYADLILNFNAGGSGSRNATMVIANNDFNGDEVNYTIELFGIGGSFATEPPQQPSALTISNLKSYTMNVSFTAPSPAPEKFIVLRKTGSAVIEIPADGSSYSAGDWIGGAKVMYVGTATSFTPKNVIANQDYHYAAFSVNGPSGFENYLTSNVPVVNATTPGGHIQNYYSGISGLNSNLLTALQQRMSTGYTQIYYANYAPTIIRDFVERDTTDGAKVINCVYSNYAYIYTGNFSWDVMSREHTYCHSWMDTYPDDTGIEYSDLHNLFPVHQDNANAVRSNNPLGEVVNVISTFMEGTYGTDIHGNEVYEPRDQHKGDAARALFYMATRWNGTNGNWGFPDPISFTIDYGQDQDVLKSWHWQDPPSDWEIARNDYIESKQGDRNPFIDSVNFVCHINFLDMTYISDPGAMPCVITPSAVEEHTIQSFSVYPNPSNGNFMLNCSLANAENVVVKIADITGRIVYEQQQSLAAGNSTIGINLGSFVSSGIYTLKLESESEVKTEKLVIK